MLVVLRPISHIFTVLDKGEPATSPALSWNIRKSCKEYSKTSLEKVTDFIFLGSKITEDGDCSHEIKRQLLLGRKTMTNLDSRHITWLTKVRIVKTMVFPVVMYGCESWTGKKAEHQRIDAFELSCWKDYCESLGLQGDQTSQSKRKLVLNTHWKD